MLSPSSILSVIGLRSSLVIKEKMSGFSVRSFFGGIAKSKRAPVRKSFQEFFHLGKCLDEEHCADSSSYLFY